MPTKTQQQLRGRERGKSNKVESRAVIDDNGGLAASPAAATVDETAAPASANAVAHALSQSQPLAGASSAQLNVAMPFSVPAVSVTASASSSMGQLTDFLQGAASAGHTKPASPLEATAAALRRSAVLQQHSGVAAGHGDSGSHLSSQAHVALASSHASATSSSSAGPHGDDSTMIVGQFVRNAAMVVGGGALQSHRTNPPVHPFATTVHESRAASHSGLGRPQSKPQRPGVSSVGTQGTQAAVAYCAAEVASVVHKAAGGTVDMHTALVAALQRCCSVMLRIVHAVRKA